MIKLKSLIEGLNYEENQLDIAVNVLEKSIILQFPQLQNLHLSYQAPDVLNINLIRIKKEERKKGIGRFIMGIIKDFADEHNLILKLSPDPEWGYKKKLEKFYKDLGFYYNKGRKKDYRLSGFGGPTMLRRPGMNEKYD